MRISGAAGEGIKTAGLILAKAATRSGYHAYNYVEYPSLIRGGRNLITVNISADPVLASKKDPDLDFDISTTNGVHKNMVAVGAILKMLGGNLDLVKDLLFDQYDEAKAGYDGATQTQEILIPRENLTKKIILNGNEAAALGAISGGLQFASIYPMSPISGILHFLAEHQTEFGYIYKQPEDEISAINMAIGASFAGARVMTATSGGGFCLMTEGISLAGMTETPVVIINGMRAGPSTGLPTWSEQGDLNLALGAGQGDFPRIVLAPGDGREVFEQTRLAFNLAEKYRTPVIILMDKNLCDHDQSFNEITNESSSRQATDQLPITNDTRKKPGMGEFFISNSYEHDDSGFTTEEIDERNLQMQKRMKKLDDCAKTDLPNPTIYGSLEASTTIVSWGSNKGAILEALPDLPDTNFLHLNWINPFPAEFVKNVLTKAKRVINVEQNISAQMGGLIRKHTGIEIKENILKYDGRPFFPEDLWQKI